MTPIEHALYEGTVRHRRRDPAYGFTAPMAMPLLDLDHLDSAWRVHPWCSDRPGRPLRFDRRDYAGDAGRPLAETVRDLVEERLGVRPEGRIRMLALLRSFGWCFNPIVVHWCEDAAGRTVAQVLDVTNTPWHERHSYVLDTRGGGDEWSVELAKALHVSPFLPMELRHRVRSRVPGASISLTIEDRDAEGDVRFTADLALTRRPFDRRSVTRMLTRFPFATQRVAAAIYWHALRLRVAGARFHGHPVRETLSE